MNINQISGLGGSDCVEYIDLSETQETLLPAPPEILSGPAAAIITSHNPSGQIWSHQSQALQLLIDGRNIVVATGTASGKSLIFQAWTFHTLKTRPYATTIVFDPIRALAEDQLQSWKQLAPIAGVNPDSIVKIDGSIPVRARDDMLREASIAIMTPDVCHAWLMNNTSSRIVQNFLADLENVILDEAHVYDSVFGSNAAYFFRRLMTSRQLNAPTNAPPCRIIAATATISNAAQHLQSLTGLEFTEINEQSNGARTYPRRLMHIDGDTEHDLIPIVRNALDLNEKFILFCDSRQGVERIARQVGAPNQVAAYRNGYEPNDRKQIESALRNGDLKGVISTSALELGINIPGLTVGINYRIPDTRKSFRQRLGRIGRHGPGLFAIVADRFAFRQFGDTLQSYYESSVESSVLYLQNRYVQMSNAQCLAKEIGSRPSRHPSVDWPTGFDDMVDYALRGKWPPDYQTASRTGHRNPHRNHPLRSIADDEISLIDESTGKRIGSIRLSHAIREAYPMAHYIHRGRTYEAGFWNPHGEWSRTEIPLSETPSREKTEPDISLDITVNSIVNGNVAINRETESYCAEVYATITETTVGYQSGSRHQIYSDDHKPTRKFDTTGVILKIEEPWFAWKPPRSTVGHTLKNFTCYDQSIANWDINWSDDPINVVSTQHPDGKTIDNAILIFDTTNGSLRLTEALFKNLRQYTEKLQKAIDLEGEPIDQNIILKLKQWAAGLHWKDDPPTP